MKSPQSQLIDLTLTQAIECYRTMEPDDVYIAIAEEWPEQIGMLLVIFLFRSKCKGCGNQPDFMRFMRQQRLSHYLAPICNCTENPS